MVASVKTSKIQKNQKVSNLNSFLQPHTSGIMSVAVTSDKKCVVYDSEDSRISIWNLLKKDKKLFCKNNFIIISLALIRDHKYVIIE